MSSENLNLPQEKFESTVSQPMELEILGTELALCFDDLDGPCQIETCYGDICKIVNALRDYAKMLRMACEEWNLQGYRQAIYELHADKLESISTKFQAGIGYDYDKAVEKCKKRAARRDPDDDVGGEALVMGWLKSQRTVAAKDKESLNGFGTAEKNRSDEVKEEVLLEVLQIEHYDFLGDVIAFWVDISGVPQAIQDKARQIDGGNFNPDCFGVCVNYDFEQGEFVVVVDTELSAEHPGNIYYIDIAGEKHWFSTKLSKPFIEQLFLACADAIDGEVCDGNAARQDAIDSAAQVTMSY